MAMWRCSIELAIPKAVYDALPAAKKQAAAGAIRDLKALAVRINEGQPNEEMTVRATYHICHHDDVNIPCEPERDM